MRSWQEFNKGLNFQHKSLSVWVLVAATEPDGPPHSSNAVVLPDVVLLAEGLSVSDKAGTVFVEKHLTLGALEAGRVPLQVGGHPQDVLVVDLPTAAHAKGILPG